MQTLISLRRRGWSARIASLPLSFFFFFFFLFSLPRPQVARPIWTNEGSKRKNVNSFGLDEDILQKIIWEDAPRPRGDDCVTKIRNRKLIRVTSSNESLKHM